MICLLQQTMSWDPSQDGANGLLFIHTLLGDTVVDKCFHPTKS